MDDCIVPKLAFNRNRMEENKNPGRQKDQPHFLIIRTELHTETTQSDSLYLTFILQATPPYSPTLKPSQALQILSC